MKRISWDKILNIVWSILLVVFMFELILLVYWGYQFASLVDIMKMVAN